MKQPLDDKTREKQFPVTNENVYMNTGTSGPTPVSVLEKQFKFLEEFNRLGPGGLPGLIMGGEALKECRRNFSSSLGTGIGEICLTHNTTEGINIALGGLDWRDGDKLITTDIEHTGGLLPCYLMRDRRGVKLSILPLTDNNDILGTVEAALTQRTRAIVISHVSWLDGRRLPVKEICAMCAERDILTIVDGAQTVGMIDVDFEDIGCDVYAIPGQKWLLGPEGTGLLYMRREMIPEVKLSMIGYESMVSHDTDGNYQVHSDARRFEVATLDTAAYLALSESMKMLYSEIGIENIEKWNLHLADKLMEGIQEIPNISLLSGYPAQSALVSFRVKDAQPPDVAKQLFEGSRIITRPVPEPGFAVRASLHIYNTEYDVELLLEKLADIA